MKKHLLIACAAFAASAVSAQSNAEIAAKWINLFDGTTAAGDQSTSISLTGDGGVCWLMTGGTTEAAPTVSYAGKPRVFDRIKSRDIETF